MMAKKNLKPIVDYEFDQNDVVYEDESVESMEAETSAADMLPEELIEKTTEKTNLYWEKRNWAGVKDVYMCKMCGEYRDSKDDMITHIVDHYPTNEQNQILDQLVKEN